jgi:hypothetical protein
MVQSDDVTWCIRGEESGWGGGGGNGVGNK